MESRSRIMHALQLPHEESDLLTWIACLYRVYRDQYNFTSKYTVHVRMWGRSRTIHVQTYQKESHPCMKYPEFDFQLCHISRIFHIPCGETIYGQCDQIPTRLTLGSLQSEIVISFKLCSHDTGMPLCKPQITHDTNDRVQL